MAYILLVELDEDELRYFRSVADFFTFCGHRADVVIDGLDALERIRAEPPDVLVAGVMLHGRDGFDLTRALRTLYPDRRAGIILLTVISAEVGAALPIFEQRDP